MSKLNKFIAIVLLISGYSVYSSEVNKDRKELKRAIRSGEIEVVKKLIQQGVDPNLKDPFTGFTPLMEVTNMEKYYHMDIEMPERTRRMIEIAEILLKAGANVNGQSDDGRTPLTLAAFNGETELVILFLMAGADIDYKSKVTGKNAYELALQHWHDGTAQVLREWPEIIKEETCKRLNETGYLLEDLNKIVADYL